MPGFTGHKALNVSLLDISPQNRAVLEFFFAGAGRRSFKITNNADADAFIVDFDLPNAKQSWEKINASLNKPTIALAFYEPDADVVWLSKPLTTQALNDAAAKIQTRLHETPAKKDSQPLNTQTNQGQKRDKAPQADKAPKLPPIDAAPNALQLKRKLAQATPSNSKKLFATKIKPDLSNKPLPPPTVVTPADKSVKKVETEKPASQPKPATSKPAVSLAQKQKRWEKLCGDAEDIQKPATWKNEVTLYTPENYLISSLQDALRLAVQSQQMVQMQYQTVTFYLIPKKAQAYCSIAIDSDAFEVICQSPVKKADVIVRLMSPNEVEQVQTVLSSSPDKLHDMEGLLWTAMLLTSSGKLHRNVDLTKRIMLRHWPNFTRIETFPYVIRISALWSNEAFNMLEVAHNLQIPQRYVFAYYNAACVLGLMEHSPEKLKTRSQTKTPTKSRGLFSRLLKRLTG